MEAWGLTIDLVSCIGLELAVGLCVDYAAHVGHTFLVTGPGTKAERALSTITHIVPAVLYGGCSTLLAVSMLADSDSYIFQSFFKVSILKPLNYFKNHKFKPSSFDLNSRFSCWL